MLVDLEYGPGTEHDLMLLDAFDRQVPYPEGHVGVMTARADAEPQAVSGSGIESATVVAGFVVKTGTGGYLYISKNVTEQSASAALTFGGGGSGIPSTINLLTLRVSPSADNDRTGGIGEREVVNRINVVVRSLDVTCSHDCTVVLLFNTSVRVSEFQRVSQVSLCEVTRHSVGEDVFGGLTLFTARVSGGREVKGRREMTTTSIDLPHNVPMTNCILGGVGVYPDGPDTLTMRIYPSDVTDVSVSDPLRVYGSMRWSER